MNALFRVLTVVAAAAAVSCSHAPPQVAQVYSQVSRVFDPEAGTWSRTLSVFVQGSSTDGTKVFDRLHLVDDDDGLYISLAKGQWTAIDRPGEFWAGVNGIQLPDKLTGKWRVLLVTKSGQKATADVQVPPTAADAPAAHAGRVSIVEADGKFRVQNWVESYLVWAYDSNGSLLSRNKTVGPLFAVPSGTTRFTLYSYDKARGEGLEAGPFLVKARPKPADS